MMIHENHVRDALNALVQSVIVDVLADKCMFQIPASDVALLRFHSHKNQACFYNPSDNSVTIVSPIMAPSIREIGYAAVLAHEYTHCWQYTQRHRFNPKLRYYDMNNVENPQNIPYAGKLFVEGCANWGEYKALDYYGADLLIDGLKPSPGYVSPQLFHRDFDEYHSGYKLMVHLEYHCDFARLIYFLETGELLYDHRVQSHKPMLLTCAHDYEEIYRNGRLGIDGDMAQLPSTWREDRHALCVRKDGYAKFQHSDRLATDFRRDYPRVTYLLGIVSKNHRGQPEDPPYVELDENPNEDLGNTVMEDLLINASKGSKNTEKQLKDCLRDLKFQCLTCETRYHCTVLDACHMHSCGEKGRSTRELMSEIARAVKPIEAEPAPDCSPEG